MSKKEKVVFKSWDQFTKECDEFDRTSFWTYFRRLDEGNIERKLRVNIYYPVKRFFSDIKHWFLYRFHPKHRYHLVDTGLAPGYYDKDYLMLCACFNLLKHYVEDELGGVEKLGYWETVTFEKSGCGSKKELTILRKRDKEILDLYIWWTKVFPARKRDSNWQQEAEYSKQDQSMLHRLITIRLHLWT